MGGVCRRRHIHRKVTVFSAVFLLLFVSATGFPLSHFGDDGIKPEREDSTTPGSGLKSGRVLFQRRFIGPGSSPPTCRGKCGGCWPCKPIHVPIQPELVTPLEYYPEAWRCKCRNKLFMP